MRNRLVFTNRLKKVLLELSILTVQINDRGINMANTIEKSEKRDWGLIVLGIVVALCGIIFIVSPGIMLVTFTMVVGAALVVAGISDIVSYVRWRNVSSLSGWMIAYAVLDIVIGLMFLLMPVAMAAVIPWVVSIFFIAFGVFEIAGSIRAKQAGFKSWGWMLFSAILAILCGIMLLVHPASIIVLIGVFAIMRGSTMIIIGASINQLFN